MESYDILANQPVVIDNVSMMMSFIHTQTEAAGWDRWLTASSAYYCVWLTMSLVISSAVLIKCAVATNSALQGSTQKYY